jgi:tRNA(Ile)-lysidine synthase
VLAGEGLDARRLATLAARLKRADAAIEAEVSRAWAAFVQSAPGGSISLESQDYFGLNEEVRLRLLGRGVAAVGDEGPVELGKLEKLALALAAAESGGRCRQTLAGALVTLERGRITVERAPPRRRRALTKPVRGPAKKQRRR